MSKYLKNKLKILIVTQYFWPEEFIINDLVKEFVAHGHDVTVLTYQPSYPKARIYKGYSNRWILKQDWQGIKVIRLKTILGYRDSLILKLINYVWFAMYASVFLLFIFKRYDKVFVYHIGPLTLAIPAIFYGRIYGSPVTIWTQDVWPNSIYAYGIKKTALVSQILDAFVRCVYRSTSSIIVSCTGFVDILKRYTIKIIQYAPNWPLSIYNEKNENNKLYHIPVFIFAGNIGKVQNLENIIRGFAVAFQNNKIKAKLRIIGDGSALSDLKALADSLGVLVEFPGRKPVASMDEEYSNSDFLILSLLNKPVFNLTIPSKFQMYLSVAKPMLCAAGGEVSEMVKEYDLGIAVDPDSPLAIAEGFIRLVNAKDEEIHNWKQNAHNALIHDFDRSNIIDTIMNIILQSNLSNVGK